MHSFCQFHYVHKTSRLQLQLRRQLNDWAGHDNEHWFDPELHRLRGIALASGGYPGEHAKAEAEMRGAIELAKSGGAKLFELRAAAALARFLHDNGRTAEARELLTPVYGWFDEGFDAPDLRDAKALLDELA